MKAKYVIVGHSERRALGEIDEMASRKVVAATKVGLNVILCVGERERDDHGEYTRFIAEELRMSLAGLSKQFLKQVVIAYEPIWAIGKNALRTASPEDVFEVVILIKKVLTDMYGAGVAESTTILYGGSVDARNASDFLKVEGVGGLLVGRASLNPKTFSNILLAANTIARERK